MSPTLKRILSDRWRRENFDPTLLGLLINPFFLTRRALARSMRALSSRARGRLLDVGCGQKPYRQLFNVSEYLGVEIDTPENRARNIHADQFYDGHHLPFGDAEFDTVLCNQVLEHVFEPDQFLAEIRRVLRPDGVLVLTVPFVWDEHEQPFDYARYSSFGLRYLLTKNGFELTEHAKTMADASALCQLANAYLYKILRTRWLPVNLLITALILAPISLWGLLSSRVLPKNSDLYLDNVVVARKAGAMV